MTTCGAQCSPATLNIWLVPFHFNMHITVTSCFILSILTATLNAHWLIVSTLQMTASFELSAAFNEQPAWQHYQPSSHPVCTTYKMQLLSRAQICFSVACGGFVATLAHWHDGLKQIPFCGAFHFCHFERGTSKWLSTRFYWRAKAEII